MRIVVIAVALLLAGCGFQLQGRRVMPAELSTLHLQVADEQSDFTRALRKMLRASGARLVDQSGAGIAEVRIRHDELTERVLSVDARNVPTDYELTYRVEVEARAAGGEELMPVQPFELSRNYSFD